MNIGVSYTYGKIGKRTSITYPDGNKVDYLYDEKLCLSKLIKREDETNYSYDEFGRLTQKLLPIITRKLWIISREVI